MQGSKLRCLLQKPTSGNHITEGNNIYRWLTGKVSHPSQGVRHRADGCMAMRWWWQCCEQSPRSRQHPIVFMPSTYKGLCRWWLISPLHVDAYGDI